MTSEQRTAWEKWLAIWRFGESPIDNSSRFMVNYDLAGVACIAYTGMSRNHSWCCLLNFLGLGLSPSQHHHYHHYHHHYHHHHAPDLKCAAFVTPFVLGFVTSTEIGPVFFTDRIIDLYFVTDIVLNFFRPLKVPR